MDITAGETDPLYVPPSNFILGNPPTYIDISTTATLVPPALVCFTYAINAFPDDVEPRMFHFTGEQWIDSTTSVNTSTRVVCGQVQSLSPFALGSLILTPDALVVKRLRMSDKSKQKDSWTFSGLFDATNVTTKNLIEAMDGNGVEFEVYGGQDLINGITFQGESCRGIGKSSSSKKLSCSMKHGQTSMTARATFQQHKHSNRLLVKAKFSRCSFDLSTSLMSAFPLKIRIITPTSLGALDSVPLSCKGSPSRVRCVAA